MSDLTKAQLRDRVLQHLGVLAAGQSASAEDATLVEEAIDSAYERLRKYGLVPFLTSVIPPWAQVPLRDFVAGDVAQAFGFGGERLGEFRTGQDHGEAELQRQLAGAKQPLRVKAEYF